MFERFTDRARRVVVLAQEEARLLNHNYIGTEHILLGLIHEGEGVAAKALESLGISLEAVRTQVVEIIGEGQSAPTGHIPFTPRAKKVLELSLREALQLGHNYIGTEHILLGLIREGEGVAAQVLLKLGAHLQRGRERVLRMLAAEPSAPDDAPGPPGAPPGSDRPELRYYDTQIASVRRAKEVAIDAQDYGTAEALRDVEQDLFLRRTQHEADPTVGSDLDAVLETNRLLRAEIERLHLRLRQHGIEPDGGTSQTA
jgi:ATP-dependent Clp protease ATP-binding subunit ClpA